MTSEKPLLNNIDIMCLHLYMTGVTRAVTLRKIAFNNTHGNDPNKKWHRGWYTSYFRFNPNYDRLYGRFSKGDPFWETLPFNPDKQLWTQPRKIMLRPTGMKRVADLFEKYGISVVMEQYMKASEGVKELM